MAKTFPDGKDARPRVQLKPMEGETKAQFEARVERMLHAFSGRRQGKMPEVLVPWKVSYPVLNGYGTFTGFTYAPDFRHPRLCDQRRWDGSGVYIDDDDITDDGTTLVCIKFSELRGEDRRVVDETFKVLNRMVRNGRVLCDKLRQEGAL